jgi:hypothetical protein
VGMFSPIAKPEQFASDLYELFAWEAVIVIYALLCFLACFGLWTQRGWSRGLSAALRITGAAVLTYDTFDLSFFAQELYWPMIGPAVAFYAVTILFLSPLARDTK